MTNRFVDGCEMSSEPGTDKLLFFGDSKMALRDSGEFRLS